MTWIAAIPRFVRGFLQCVWPCAISDTTDPDPDAARMEGAPALFGLDMEPDIRGIDDIEDADLIRERLGSMPLFVREVFLRITVDRQSVGDVALHLGLSQRRVSHLLDRAIAILNGRE